jgi:hypothetical protein
MRVAGAGRQPAAGRGAEQSTAEQKGQPIMSTAEQSMTLTVQITPNDRGNPPGKLADAEVHFHGGPLAGLKLIGFAVWERRGGGRNVTFPARSYAVNGERRTFALLRPAAYHEAQYPIRDLILEAYAQYEAPATGGAPATVAPAGPPADVADPF